MPERMRWGRKGRFVIMLKASSASPYRYLWWTGRRWAIHKYEAHVYKSLPNAMGIAKVLQEDNTDEVGVYAGYDVVP